MTKMFLYGLLCLTVLAIIVTLVTLFEPLYVACGILLAVALVGAAIDMLWT